MDDDETTPAIERNETYNHEQHGTVEVTGIWQGVNRVDATRDRDTSDTIIVNFTVVSDSEMNTELTDTLDGFVNALEQTD